MWGIGAGRGSAEAVLAGSLLGIGCPPWYVIMLKDLMFSLGILYCCSMYILVINWIIPNHNEKSLFVCIQVDFNCNYGEVLSAYEDSCFWFYYSLFTNVPLCQLCYRYTSRDSKWEERILVIISSTPTWGCFISWSEGKRAAFLKIPEWLLWQW